MKSDRVSQVCALYPVHIPVLTGQGLHSVRRGIDSMDWISLSGRVRMNVVELL